MHVVLLNTNEACWQINVHTYKKKTNMSQGTTTAISPGKHQDMTVDTRAN